MNIAHILLVDLDIEIDVRGLTFCDVSGLNTLLAARTSGRYQGGSVRLHGALPADVPFLAMTGTRFLIDGPSPLRYCASSRQVPRDRGPHARHRPSDADGEPRRRPQRPVYAPRPLSDPHTWTDHDVGTTAHPRHVPSRPPSSASVRDGPDGSRFWQTVWRCGSLSGMSPASGTEERS
ncbi:STAS domain-containing protein [Streptomyces sp. NPDC002870]|uniref:STAS domain-containing protein n=1 Tax=Streptomyces sp. NPDC002870 TaxID=3364666 RepID=UPI0036CF5136